MLSNDSHKRPKIADVLKELQCLNPENPVHPGIVKYELLPTFFFPSYIYKFVIPLRTSSGVITSDFTVIK